MRTLLRYFSWRYARNHPVRILLGALAVALGVALFVSGDVSNASAEVAFRRTVEKLAGRAQLQVVRGRSAGVEESILKLIDAEKGVRAAPVIQLGSNVSGSPETLLILGLDLGREAEFRRWDVAEGVKPQINPLAFLGGDVVLVSRAFAARRGLKLGSSFRIDTPGGPRPVTIGAIFNDEGPAQVFKGNIAVLPLRTAQRLFRREGSVDRIEILVTGDVDAAARRLQAALGPEYRVVPPPTRNSLLDESLTRLKALMGISVVALLVGIFIIYNSVSISVVERVREIGTLRAIGATRAQIFGVVLLEWMLVGLAGSAAGIAGGVALARALMDWTVREVNQMALVVDVSGIEVPPRTLIAGMLLGTLTTLVAAFAPARAAMSVSPIEMLREGTYLMKAGTGYRRTFGIGVFFILVSVVILMERFHFENVGLVASFFAFLGAALVMPQATLWATGLARPVLRRLFSLGGFLAADSIAKHPQRTALTVVALAGALAMMVASASIIVGLKVRSAQWMDEAFPFDCTVNAVDYATSLYANVTLPDGVQEAVEGVDGVDFTYGCRALLQDYGERDIMLFALDLDRYSRMQSIKGKAGFVPKGALPELMAGKGLVVSDNFARLHRIAVGDRLELATPKGPRGFAVLGTYEEYSWPQGAIFIHRPVYRELWNDPSISYVDVKYKGGAPREETRRRIEAAVKGATSIFVYDVADLKRVGDETMDRTLRLTNVQVAVSVIIGFLGIVNTLLISVMGRTREIGLLRAVGMTKAQVAGMILVESLFVAGIGAGLGVALGLAGARWPLALHVAQISGYWMPLYVPWETIGLAVGAAFVIGALASVLPARRAAGINVLQAVKYE